MIKLDFIKELKSFQTIVEEGTFTKAAKKLNYSQSTITNHIIRLESELGVSLFFRGTSNILTVEGELLKDEAPVLISQWVKLREKLKNSAINIDHVIRLGIIHPYDTLILPDLVFSFSQKYPKINFEIIVGSTLELANALEEDHIDFALCSLPHSDKFLFEEIFKEAICCITSTNNPLVFNDLSDFGGLHFYRSGNGCPYRRRIETFLDSAVSGIRWEHVNNITTIPFLVEKTGYYSILPKSIVENSQAKLKILSIPLPNNSIPIGLLSLKVPKNLSSIDQEFINNLEKILKK